MDVNEIKRVDYLDFVSGDANKRSAFIRDFGDSFSNMGFAIVANHGVAPDLKNRLYEVIENFFSLDDHIKKKYEKEEVAGQRGYISKNKESAKGKEVPDLKEFYHVGQELPPDELAKFDYPYQYMGS